MDSELKLALGVLAGLFDSKSFDIFGTGPLSRDRYPFSFDPIQFKLGGGIRWQVNCNVAKSHHRTTSITCHSGKDTLYPSRLIERIEGTRRAHESFDRFYAAVLRRYPFVAEYMKAMKALAPA